MQQTFTVTLWPRQDYSFPLEPAVSNYFWIFHLPEEMQHFPFCIKKKKKKTNLGHGVIFTVITFHLIAWILFTWMKDKCYEKHRSPWLCLSKPWEAWVLLAFSNCSFFAFFFFCNVLTGISVLLLNLCSFWDSRWHEIVVAMLSGKSMNQCLKLSCSTLRNLTWILRFML